MHQRPGLRTAQLEMAIHHRQLLAVRIGFQQCSFKSRGYQRVQLEGLFFRSDARKACQDLSRTIKQQGGSMLVGSRQFFLKTFADKMRQIDEGDQNADQFAIRVAVGIRRVYLAHDGQCRDAFRSAQLLDHFCRARLRGTLEQRGIMPAASQIAGHAAGTYQAACRVDEQQLLVTIRVGPLQAIEHPLKVLLDCLFAIFQLFREHPVFSKHQDVAAPRLDASGDQGVLVVSLDFQDAHRFGQTLIAGADQAELGQAEVPEREQYSHRDQKQRAEIACDPAREGGVHEHRANPRNRSCVAGMRVPRP